MNNFKECPYCHESWLTVDDFLIDKYVEIIGYQADFDKLEDGIFFFNHRKPNCGTTLALEVYNFRGLHSGKVYSERKTNSEECPLFCFDQKQLERCSVQCECAFVREILQVIKDRKGVLYEIKMCR